MEVVREKEEIIIRLEQELQIHINIAGELEEDK